MRPRRTIHRHQTGLRSWRVTRLEPPIVGPTPRGATGRGPTARTRRRPPRPLPRPGGGLPARPLSRVEPRWTQKKRAPPVACASRASWSRADRRSGTGPSMPGLAGGARRLHRSRTGASWGRAPTSATSPRPRPRRPRFASAADRRSGQGGSAPRSTAAGLPSDARSQRPRTSPTTLPRIRTSFSPSRTTIGAMVGCSGLRRTACPSRANRLTVASPSTSATTMSPD